MITVVGAGIVGAACALALARAGLRPRVVDGRPPGTGVSAEGMGHVLALDHGAPTLALSRRSLELWHALGPALPRAAEWSGAGTLWLARDDAELDRAWGEAARLQALGLDVSRLDAQAARALEPCLAPTLAGALRVADDRVVYPPAVAAWMIERARALGAEVLTGVPVLALEGGGPQGEELRLADGRRLHCERLVLATGLGTGALLASPSTAPLASAITPRRGHLLITERVDARASTGLGRLRHQLVELGYHDSVARRGETSVAFNLQPRATGQLLLGSSRQDIPLPSAPLARARAVDPDVLARMVQRARPFVTGLEEVRGLRAWVGLRPATSDGLPFIGPVPGRPALLLAAGHEGLGITTSLATAELIAAQLGGAPSALDPSPFLPARLLPLVPLLPLAGDKTHAA